ncbi:MAG TPA: ribonuclease J [Chloroflexota bacterium]|nr:ribonuclease J [Chloroflexota bacterium]
MAKSPLRVILLGGVGEIGKNATVYEYEGSLLLVDAGVKFPDDEMLGIDLVIPDFEYVVERADALRAIVLTHAHEDHIGSLPFLIRQLPAAHPVVLAGAPLTLGLVDVKLAEYGVRDRVIYHQIEPTERHQFGPFAVEFIHVNHSVPDAVALAVRCGAGVVVHTGDFKFDPTPLDENPSDTQRLAELGREGVLALLCDTTRVEEPGRTGSERVVGESLTRIIERAPGRVILATFASNITRLRQVMGAAHVLGRRVAVTGRSMIRNIEVAHEMGYMPEMHDVMVDLKDVRHLPPTETVLLTTGSQGEPASALARMAVDDHRDIKIAAGDTVILSATPIPGNEATVARTINNLYRRGAEVVTRRRGTDTENIHVSGHASRDEIRDMIHLVQPRYCVPLHGEYRNLMQFRTLAGELGIPQDHVIITDIGDVVEFRETGASKVESVSAGAVLVDGLTLGVTHAVLRDRHKLAAEGVLVVTIAIDSETGRVVAGPSFITRGVFGEEGLEDALLDEARQRVLRALARLHGEPEHSVLVAKIREVIDGFLYHHTRRRPMILPVVTEI